MKDKYRTLIEGVCRKGGISDPEVVLERGHLAVNGISFTLLHAELADPDLVLIYCDFGELPRDRREQALQRLLEVNLYLYGGAGPGFSFNKDSGHVLLMAQVRLPGATVDSVLTALGALAAYAKEWREGHLLNDMRDHSPAASRVSLGSAAMKDIQHSPFSIANT
ncbi:MAG TPA: CesT family type III secretion system chaperone [Albitalea sp.]|uniref:CesT family type III secretion system chaperone n=1 Tax=Piscinibacter sp. TaxID=1903157 RepID=UPI002ED30BCE